MDKKVEHIDKCSDFDQFDEDLTSKVKDAFDSVTLPDDVRMRTLKALNTMQELEEVQPPKNRVIDTIFKKHALQFSIGIAACMIIVLMGVFGISAIVTPTAYVDIDINPSIEIAVNCYDNVVDAKAINEDGEAILNGINLVGKSYPDAIDELMTQISEHGYSNDDLYLEFSISSDNTNQAQTLETDAYVLMADCGYSGNCSVLDNSIREQAHNNNMGMGKYVAAQELIELDPSITLEECSHMSMREIRDNIARFGDDENKAGQNNGQQAGHHYGGQSGNNSDSQSGSGYGGQTNHNYGNQSNQNNDVNHGHHRYGSSNSKSSNSY